ncbi:MAG: SHOCT domain-containing protein [Chloroflexi bacterium]|nr:SHOCT domain-containing protein [Chloroflexota bacterium]
MQPGGPGGFVSPLFPVLTFLAWILVVGGVVLLGVWLVRTLWPEVGATGAAPEEPVRIAQVRYARGEISREEYERIRQDLSKAA